MICFTFWKVQTFQKVILGTPQYFRRIIGLQTYNSPIFLIFSENNWEINCKSKCEGLFLCLQTLSIHTY